MFKPMSINEMAVRMNGGFSPHTFREPGYMSVRPDFGIATPILPVKVYEVQTRSWQVRERDNSFEPQIRRFDPVCDDPSALNSGGVGGRFRPW